VPENADFQGLRARNRLNDAQDSIFFRCKGMDHIIILEIERMFLFFWLNIEKYDNMKLAAACSGWAVGTP